MLGNNASEGDSFITCQTTPNYDGSLLGIASRNPFSRPMAADQNHPAISRCTVAVYKLHIAHNITHIYKTYNPTSAKLSQVKILTMLTDENVKNCVEKQQAVRHSKRSSQLKLFAMIVRSITTMSILAPLLRNVLSNCEVERVSPAKHTCILQTTTFTIISYLYFHYAQNICRPLRSHLYPLTFPQLIPIYLYMTSQSFLN